MATNGNRQMSIDDFNAFVERNNAVPDDDDDTPFVLDHFTNIEAGQPSAQKYNADKFNFVCVLTTKRLLKNAFEGNVFHADSTYKLNWAGYPVHLFGVSDSHQSFHLIAIAFSSKETQDEFAFCIHAIKQGIMDIYEIEIDFGAFMSDACGALKKAFSMHFPNVLQLICYFHVKKAIKQRKFQREANRIEFMSNLTSLHLSSSLEIFEKATKLFVSKWKPKEKEVVNYFTKQWLSPSNKFWFAGAMAQAPCTNNAVESTNARIKDDFDFRSRPKLHIFTQKIFHILNVFSNEYKDGIKMVRMDVPIKDKLWEEAMLWAKSEKKAQPGTNIGNDYEIYFVPSGEARSVSKKDMKAFTDQKWTSFGELVEITTKVWRVKMHTVDNRKTTCTCPAYLKENVCKHALGLHIRLKTIDVPARFLCMENKKKKRGRPAHIPPALVRE